MVTRLTQRKIKGVVVDGKELKFGNRTNSFEVSDPGLAREIEAQHGPKATGEVVVAQHAAPREHGHRYTFGQWPEMPWKKGKQND